jgi:hypothetical protein
MAIIVYLDVKPCVSDISGGSLASNISVDYPEHEPVPVAARSKPYVFGRSPAEIVVSNLTGGMDVCLL